MPKIVIHQSVMESRGAGFDPKPVINLRFEMSMPDVPRHGMSIVFDGDVVNAGSMVSLNGFPVVGMVAFDAKTTKYHCCVCNAVVDAKKTAEFLKKRADDLWELDELPSRLVGEEVRTMIRRAETGDSKVFYATNTDLKFLTDSGESFTVVR